MSKSNSTVTHKPEQRAYEILTTYSLNGVKGSFVGRYIVISTDADRALKALPLRTGEVVLEAHEMRHWLVLAQE